MTLFAEKFQFYAEDHDRFTGDRDVEKVRELNPALQSFEAWLSEHRDQLKSAQN